MLTKSPAAKVLISHSPTVGGHKVFLFYYFQYLRQSVFGFSIRGGSVALAEKPNFNANVDLHPNIGAWHFWFVLSQSFSDAVYWLYTEIA